MGNAYSNSRVYMNIAAHNCSSFKNRTRMAPFLKSLFVTHRIFYVKKCWDLLHTTKSFFLRSLACKDGRPTWKPLLTMGKCSDQKKTTFFFSLNAKTSRSSTTRCRNWPQSKKRERHLSPGNVCSRVTASQEWKRRNSFMAEEPSLCSFITSLSN